MTQSVQVRILVAQPTVSHRFDRERALHGRTCRAGQRTSGNTGALDGWRPNKGRPKLGRNLTRPQAVRGAAAGSTGSGRMAKSRPAAAMEPQVARVATPGGSTRCRQHKRCTKLCSGQPTSGASERGERQRYDSGSIPQFYESRQRSQRANRCAGANPDLHGAFHGWKLRPGERGSSKGRCGAQKAQQTFRRQAF